MITVEIPGRGPVTVEAYTFDRAMGKYAELNETVMCDVITYATGGDLACRELHSETQLLAVLCELGLPDIPSDDVIDNMYAIMRRAGVINPGPYDCQHCGREFGH